MDNPAITSEHAEQSKGSKPTIERVIAYVVPIEGANDVVYGLLLIGALLAGESGQHETFTETVLATIVVTVLAWLAHAYATLLGWRLSQGRRMSVASVGAALRRDAILLRGGLVPLSALIACWLAGISEMTAVTVAIIAVVVAIIALEVIAAVVSDAGRTELVIDAAFGLLLGLSIFLLKVVLH